MQADFVIHEPRRPITQVITEEVTSWITSGRYKPGDSLPPEGELARIFNVSKPSVREALKNLVAFGAVEISHGRPPTVRSMNSAPLTNFFHLAITAESGGIKEAIELRRGLEIQSTLLAAKRATDEDIVELGRILDLLDKAKNDRELWVPTHVEFHQTIVKSAHNRFYSFLQEALKATIETTIRELIAAQPKRDVESTFKRHVAIFEALKARDTALAGQAVVEHFDAVDRVLLTMQ
jgi:GntR family transcriptional regulator, transcriptional repressor for pyruvate dehydrogenase complex